MGITMKICPKCAEFKGTVRCSFCNIDKIETELEVGDVMKMSPKEEKEYINNLINTLIKDTYDPELAKQREAQERPVFADYVPDNRPECPICHSKNLSKISNIGKATKIGVFGIFGAGDLGKTYKCNNCGSRF